MTTDTGTLALGEAHPASCAVEGDRLSEVCGETLNRLLNGEPVSDRYVLGLAWSMRYGESDAG